MSVEIALSKDRGRPRERTASNVSNGMTSIRATASLVIDLSIKDQFDWEGSDRHRLEVLDRTPDNAHVLIYLNENRAFTHPSMDAVRILRQADKRVNLQLVSPDDQVLRVWMNALRGAA